MHHDLHHDATRGVNRMVVAVDDVDNLSQHFS